MASLSPSKSPPKKHKPLSTSTTARMRQELPAPTSPSKKQRPVSRSPLKTTPHAANSPVKKDKKKPVTQAQLPLTPIEQPSKEITPRAATSPEENYKTGARSKKKPVSVQAQLPLAPIEHPPKEKEQEQRRATTRTPSGDRKGQQRRYYIFGAVGCCLIILIIGLVLGLVVFRNGGKHREDQASGNSDQEDDGNAPDLNNSTDDYVPSSPSAPVLYPISTPRPTSPGAPTFTPTRSPTPRPTTLRPSLPPAPIQVPTALLQPTPSQIIVLPYADTYVYRDGFNLFEAFGKEDTFLVQNGPSIVRDEIADAVGLLAFDLSDALSNGATGVQRVALRLYHEPANQNRGAAVLTIRRLPATSMAIESFHAGIFDPADDEGVVGPSFSVNPDDTIVEVDITDLALNRNHLFLMLENNGAEQSEGAAGDRFFSRETDDPPQLILSIT